jgi:hypothetical protein
MQPRSASRQLLNQPADMIGPVRHRSKVAHLTTALALRNGDRDRRLVDIQPDEGAILHPVSPPFLRPGTRQPGAPPRTENAAGKAANPVRSKRDHGV